MKRITCNLLLSLLMTLLGVVAFAQDRTITGKVTDATNNALPGVTVVVQGTTNGTITDTDGAYSLKISDGNTLQFSFIGYITQNIEVGNQSIINVEMAEQALDIDEVVVVGYGTIKKNDLTGSVGSIDSENLVMKGSPSVLQSMQGAVPGVSITQSGSRDQAGFDIQIRGKSSINAEVSPLYVVDGVICGDIDFLNPQDIERIDILKDASSTAIYGSRATAGVVMVTTKSGITSGAKSETKPSVSYDAYYGASQLAVCPTSWMAKNFTDSGFCSLFNKQPARIRNPYIL